MLHFAGDGDQKIFTKNPRHFSMQNSQANSKKKSTIFFLESSQGKKPYTALLECRTFLCRKKWVPQRKDFGGGYGFPGFYRVFVSTTGLESFSLRPEKFSKRFSFGGGCVRFFLL